MIYLLEIDPVDPATGQVRTLRYGSAPFITEPGDAPPNVPFEERLADPGNYERFLFGRSTTRGESDVGGGDIQLVNADGALDFMLVDDLAFDGRAFRLYGVAEGAGWADRITVLVGTMEQVEFPSRRVSIRIRDRLALLREPLQTATYLGTTTSGAATVAEGNTDLKDVKKPLLFGRCFSISPVLVDQFNHIYQVSSAPIAAVTSVRDTGVPRTATQDHPTLAALRSAALSGGQYATCLALGLIRLQGRPEGTITVDANEGATLASRSCARIARRIIGTLAPVVEADFDALHAANPAECGLWLSPGETTGLAAATTVLQSIGAFLTVDRFGMLRTGRLELPAGDGEVVIDESNILGNEAIFRQALGDTGSGVPARSVTVRYARNYSPFAEGDLKTVATDDAFRTFGTLEWRPAKKESPTNLVLHPKGPELVFDTCLVERTDAEAEATRLLAFYGARRDLFVVNVWADEVPTVDLNDVVTLAPDRFGMGGGVPGRVIGITNTFATNIAELEILR